MRRRVLLIADLTRYHKDLVIGLPGWTLPPLGSKQLVVFDNGVRAYVKRQDLIEQTNTTTATNKSLTDPFTVSELTNIKLRMTSLLMETVVEVDTLMGLLIDAVHDAETYYGTVVGEPVVCDESISPLSELVGQPESTK